MFNHNYFKKSTSFTIFEYKRAFMQCGTLILAGRFHGPRWHNRLARRTYKQYQTRLRNAEVVSSSLTRGTHNFSFTLQMQALHVIGIPCTLTFRTGKSWNWFFFLQNLKYLNAFSLKVNKTRKQKNGKIMKGYIYWACLAIGLHKFYIKGFTLLCFHQKFQMLAATCCSS